MAVPSLPLLTKPEQRAQALAARRDFARALEPKTRAALELALAERVLPHIVAARVVAGYYPLKDEVSPLPILDRLGAGQRASLPWFASRDARMIWREAPAQEPSPWGVLQPPAAAEALAPDLVPWDQPLDAIATPKEFIQCRS
jgi:5-formyltetrahydrofolate cyclo-ligase